jgi:malate/lactate dehydrogenase
VQLGADVQDIRRVTIWGNHSSTQYPDIAHATVKGAPVSLDEEWVQAVFVPTVQKRGAAVIAARKLSSAMSAAKVWYHNNKDQGRENGGQLLAVLGIRIRRIRMFLGLPDPDKLVRGTDPDPSLFS